MRERIAPGLPLSWSNADLPPFVGREAEVGVLFGAWGDAARGLGRAVFVVGEPGIGKSRLVSEVCTRLHAEGASIYVGSCIPEFGTPYEPFLHPLRGLRSRTLASGAEGADSASILDVLTDRREAAYAAPAGQSLLYDAIVDAIKAEAGQGAIVLVLEDLQWADAASIRLLSRLVEATGSTPVLIIGTARSTQPDASPELISAIARMSRLSTVKRLDLVALNEDEITTYLHRRDGISTDTAAAARTLHDLTGGNPFLLRETWSRTLAAMRAGDRGVAMPETVHDLLRSRIEALGPAGLSSLQFAATLGQEVDLGELIAVSDSAADQTMESVDAAVMLGLLEPLHLAGGRYRFPHAIARQVVIDQMPATRATQLHAKVATVLEQQFPTAPRIVQRLAHHYEAAQALGFREKAAANLERAAVRAADGLAFEEAAHLYERAASCAVAVVQRDALRLSAARCWTATADFAKVLEVTEPLAAQGAPEQRAEAAMLYAQACFLTATPGMRASELLRAALDALPSDGDASLRVRAVAALGRATVQSGRIADGEALCRDAIAAARQADDVDTLADALYYGASAISMPGPPDKVAQSLSWAAEALEVAGPDHDALGPSALYAAIGCYATGDPEGMDAAERILLDVARRSGPYWRYWITCIRFSRALSGGRLSDARSAYRTLSSDERQLGTLIAPGADAVQGYILRRETGAIDQIAHLITGEEPPGTRWMPGLLALYTELEMIEPTHRTLSWLLNRAQQDLWDPSDRRAQLVFLAEAALFVEDRRAASLIRPWLADYAGSNLIVGQFVAPFGSADRYIGQLDSLCGVGDPEALFRGAIQIDRRMGAHLHVAYSWVALAAHLFRSGESKDKIREASDTARSIAEPAGMERVLRQLRELDRLVGTQAQDGLTAREVDVIRLVAEGLSNREIATRLVISEHTAANHVRSILFKLNADNRTQAAIFARQRGIA